MAVEQVYNEQKFKELMLYVADRMSDDASFGATKLNKVLFFSDFFHYAEFGKSITGADYQKLPHGPAPRRLLPAQSELVAEQDAVVRRVQVGNYAQKRLVPLRDADLEGFSGTEIAMVQDIIDRLSGRSAVQVSDASHRMLGWRAAAEHDTIPYSSVFLYDGPITSDDEAFAKDVANTLREEMVPAGHW